MKSPKLLLPLAFAAVTTWLVSCGNKLKDDYIAIIHESTEDVKKATTFGELEKATARFTTRLSEYERNHQEELKALTEDRDALEEIQKANQEYAMTAFQKNAELGE